MRPPLFRAHTCRVNRNKFANLVCSTARCLIHGGLSQLGYFSCKRFVLKRMDAALSVNAAPKMTLESTIGSNTDSLRLGIKIRMNF